MYPITNEVKALFESEQRKVLRITGTDKNGRSISITDDNVIADSFQVDRYSCNGEKLEIGTAIAAQLTLTLENGNGQYDSIAFEGAELFVEVGVADWTQSSPTIHWVPCGYFTPDEQLKRMSTISITALDRMMRFDAVPPTLIPWTTANGDVMTTQGGAPIYFLKSVRFPCTIAQLVQQIATLCNVPFTQSLSGFPNYDATIQELPVTVESTSYRLILQWCAAIMACNAWIDWTGSLRFSWYTNATSYVSTTDNRYNSDLYENDLSITGVAYTNSSGVEFVEGTDEYTIDIIGNSLIGQQVASMLPNIATALNGFTYRPFTAAAVNAPYLWPMDIITFTDKDGNDHTSALTNVAFGLNGTTALESNGMTYAVNRGKQPSGMTKQQAQLVNEVRESVDKLDDSLTQQEIFNRLTDSGAAQGLVLYNGQLYINASYINAGFLSAARIKGDILTLGGANNVNGVLRVLDASGNVVVTLNNAGADITDGSVVAYSDDRQQRVLLSEGIVTFQYYNDVSQPIGWRDAFKLSIDDALDAQISTYGGGGGGNLYIGGSSRVRLSNQEDALDENSAEIDMDDDSIVMSVRSGIGVIEGASIQLTPDSFRMSHRDPLTGDTSDVFELVPGGESNTPLDIGNGGTGVSLNDSPSMLVDLGSNSADDVFQAAPRPGVTGVLDITNGGTGADNDSDARDNLDVPSRSGDGASGEWDIDITGNAETATGVKDAGDSSRIITIRYWGNGAPASDWIPMHDSSGDLVPVSSTNLANKVRDKASGSWDIDITGNAANVTGTVPVTHGGTGATTNAGARSSLGIRYSDERIRLGDTEVDLALSSTFFDVVSLLHVNPLNSVCNIKGAQPVNGSWYVFSEPVQVADAWIRVFYIDK